MLLAFAIIYFVWGSTFLAIRVGVREVPPFLLAGMRFLVAGRRSMRWMRARGTPSPTAREWGAASLLAILIFVLDYGLLFWAETARAVGNRSGHDGDDSGVHGAGGDRVPADATAHPAARGLRCLVGIGGVAVLVSHSVSLGEAPDRHCGRVRLDRCGDQLVGGCVPKPQAAACPQPRR